jgi:hypothetical protein
LACPPVEIQAKLVTGKTNWAMIVEVTFDCLCASRTHTGADQERNEWR